MKVVPVAHDVICEGCNRLNFNLHDLNLCVSRNNKPACKVCNTDLSYTVRLFPVYREDSTEEERTILSLDQTVKELFASPSCRVIEIEDDEERMYRVDFY